MEMNHKTRTSSFSLLFQYFNFNPAFKQIWTQLHQAGPWLLPTSDASHQTGSYIELLWVLK